ncbi:MAG: hydrogenase subunit MbhD domain-containing protein [Alphaproteobacteria bacterium]
MTDQAFDLLLCVVIVGTALAAVAGRDLFGAVVFFIAYGVFVAIAWTRLGAIDVALAEAAIGAGLTGVLLVGATARLQRLAPARSALQSKSPQSGPPQPGPGEPKAAGRLGHALTALACAGVAGLLGAAVLAMDPAGAGLTPQVAENLQAAGVGNPVTAVLLNFRAYDTLLESIVLLVALVGVWSVTQDGAWGQAPGLRQHVRSDGVLATFGRFLPPVGLTVGIYLVWTGAEQPGGAFQGGTVLAAVWLLVAMAGLAEAPRVGSRRLRLALVAGPAVFLGLGAAGALAGTFLGFPEAQAKTLILAVEAALTLSIAVTLALLVVGPPQGRPA